MKKLLPAFCLSIAFVSAGTFVYGQSPSSGNQVNIATFAAAPIAHYDHIWLHPRDSDLGDPCNAGTVFFSASQNDLIYCQDDGTGAGTGTFNIVGGGLWKKTGDNIYLKDTVGSPGLRIGIGTTEPEAPLDVAGDVILQSLTGQGDFKWLSKNSQLSIGNITLSTSTTEPQIGINLGTAANPVLATDNTMAVVGGTVIIGDTEHIHIVAGGGGVGGGGAGGGGVNFITDAVFTAVGDSDFVGKSYFHDDVATENDLTVNGDFGVVGNATFGNISASSITVGTINASKICVQGCGDPFWEVWINNDIGWSGSSSSDGRFKTNISPLMNGLKTISGLNPVTYQWKNLEKDESGKIVTKDGVNPDVHLGLIAQETYQIIPDAVNKPDDESKDMWSINYQEIVPVLIQAAKEQKLEFDALKAEVEALKQELNALKTSP